jgi:hypothetical protein
VEAVLPEVEAVEARELLREEEAPVARVEALLQEVEAVCVCVWGGRYSGRRRLQWPGWNQCSRRWKQWRPGG